MWFQEQIVAVRCGTLTFGPGYCIRTPCRVLGQGRHIQIAEAPADKLDPFSSDVSAHSSNLGELSKRIVAFCNGVTCTASDDLTGNALAHIKMAFGFGPGHPVCPLRSLLFSLILKNRHMPLIRRRSKSLWLHFQVQAILR